MGLIDKMMVVNTDIWVNSAFPQGSYITMSKTVLELDFGLRERETEAEKKGKSDREVHR